MDKSNNSDLVHQPFPAHEVNIFNPPKNMPNGSLTPTTEFINAIVEQPLKSEAEILPKPLLATSAKSLNLASTSSKLPFESLPHHRNWWDNLISPWGIASILIVLLTNVGASYLILKYSSASNVYNSEAELPIQDFGLDLSTREFKELNLQNLSTVPSNAIASTEEEPATSDLEDIEVPTLSDSATLPPSNGLITQQSEYHYVLTEYTGEKSLELARQKVNNVSLVNFPQGMFIYLGAFRDRNYAREFAASLRKEGMEAYLYPEQ